MPKTLNFTIDALRRIARSLCDPFFALYSSRALRAWLGATLAYAVAVAVVAGCMLPTFLSSQPVAGLLPKPPPIVARSPAPDLKAAL